MFRKNPKGRSLDRLKQELQEAVLSRNHKKLELLLSKVNINVINSKGLAKSTFNLAASIGDIVSFELLLDYGAVLEHNYHTKNDWVQSTFFKACQGGNHQIIRLLVNNGFDPGVLKKASIREPNSKDNVWYKIIELDNLTIFQLLLNCKRRKVVDAEWSQEMLVIAYEQGSKMISKYLLNQGVSVESADENGWTCLFHAVASSSITDVNMLIARGANLQHKDCQGRNLFHIIIPTFSYDSKNMRAPEIIKILVDNGVDINARDKKGLTPINMAFCTDYGIKDELVCLFLRQPEIDLSIPDYMGVTVLHRAISFGNQNLLKTIICQNNINTNSYDNQGRTPIEYLKNKNVENLSFLLEFGAANKKSLRDLYQNFRGTGLCHLINILGQYNIKRIIANLSDNLNVEAILTHNYASLNIDRDKLVSMYSTEIEQMKMTQLYGRMTFYDFLHADELTCIKVAKQPRMREILLESKHDFVHYSNMLTKNYLYGVRLKPIESNTESNLNILFHNRLPSLIIFFIKSISFDDMLTLENMKLRENISKFEGANQEEKNVKAE